MSKGRLNKRFYETVTVDQAEDGWRVLLDGRQVRTPGKLRLTLPTQALAERVAAEWNAQDERINPSLMPVTRLANVAIEQTPGRRDDLAAEARRYAETDLVSYRAPDPRVLRERQSAAWDIWQDWAAKQGVSLETTQALQAIAQPDESLNAVEHFALGLDNIRLTLFVHLIAVYGSVVLALAVLKNALTAEAAFDVSRVDADYQIELWGEDEEQADITAALRAETIALGDVLEIL